VKYWFHSEIFVRYSKTLERYFPAKPDGFLPAPALYVGLLLANFVAVAFIPLVSDTPSFTKVAILSRSLPFSFLLLPYIIPDSWGKVHTHAHSAHTTYITLFRTISYSSVLLHGYSTSVALFKNVPDSTYYRHSILLPFKKEYRSTFDRGTSAIRHVLGAIGEHPAVTSIGLDVLLSGLTLGTWAAIRGLDARKMLASSVPFAKPVLKELEKSTTEVKEEVEKTINKYVFPLSFLTFAHCSTELKLLLVVVVGLGRQRRRLMQMIAQQSQLHVVAADPQRNPPLLMMQRKTMLMSQMKAHN
jgi:hypothetical protein